LESVRRERRPSPSAVRLTAATEAPWLPPRPRRPRSRPLVRLSGPSTLAQAI